jgi:hypothetical protein
MKETIGKLRPLPYPLWAHTVSPHRMLPLQQQQQQQQHSRFSKNEAVIYKHLQ